jgi:hypothetical protein
MGYGSEQIETDHHELGPVLIRNDPSKFVAHLREVISLGPPKGGKQFGSRGLEIQLRQ